MMEMGFSFFVGFIEIKFFELMKLRSLDDKFDIFGVEENVNRRELSVYVFDCFDVVQVRQVVYQVFNIFRECGLMLIVRLVDENLLILGLEELVVYL